MTPVVSPDDEVDDLWRVDGGPLADVLGLDYDLIAVLLEALDQRLACRIANSCQLCD